MVPSETLLSYPDWTITFKAHTNASDKQVCDFISQNNKHIDFFSRILSKPQRKCPTTEK